jgi:hypothetical protein
MVGSVAVAAWIAIVAFPVLLVWGWLSGELGVKALVIFALMGLAAWLGLSRLAAGGNFVTPVLAVIDIALVLVVFKGDVRIG